MDEDTTIKSTIQLNVLAAAIFFVGFVLLARLIIDVTQRPPERGDPNSKHPAITVVGFREKSGSESYDSFTVFENDGAVYIYWREGAEWKSRPLPHYK